MHPLQSSVFLKRVLETQNCAFLGRAAFQLKPDRRQGAFFRGQTVLSVRLERRFALSFAELRVEQEAGMAEESQRPELESFPFEAGSLAGPHYPH